MCQTSLLPLLVNEVEMKRDHSKQPIAKPSLFIEDVFSTVACFLFCLFSLICFV